MKMKMKILLFGVIFAAYTLLPFTANAAPIPSPDEWYSCQAVEVLEFSKRIHVKCSNPIKHGQHTIKYISIDTLDKDKANRFMSLATTAVVSGLTFLVRMSGDPAKNPSGCSFSDCRYPIRFGLKR